MRGPDAGFLPGNHKVIYMDETSKVESIETGTDVAQLAKHGIAKSPMLTEPGIRGLNICSQRSGISFQCPPT